MSKTYRPYEPNQQLLLPAAMREWLPDDHLAYFISDVVDQLELSEITARYERESRGGPPYHPRMMVKVLLYSYCVGVASSRRIAQRLHEDIAFPVLSANNTPDFRTTSDFRKDNLDALSGLFLQVLALCRQAGLVKLGHVALACTVELPRVWASAASDTAQSVTNPLSTDAAVPPHVRTAARLPRGGVAANICPRVLAIHVHRVLRHRLSPGHAARLRTRAPVSPQPFSPLPRSAAPHPASAPSPAPCSRGTTATS